MTIHLKNRHHYIDRYDKLAIEDCRRKERFHRSHRHKFEDGPDGIKFDEVTQTAFSEIPLHYDLLHATIYWYENKEKTITSWMESDQKKDELYENAAPPRGVRCLNCNRLVSVKDKMLYDHARNRFSGVVSLLNKFI